MATNRLPPPENDGTRRLSISNGDPVKPAVEQARLAGPSGTDTKTAPQAALGGPGASPNNNDGGNKDDAHSKSAKTPRMPIGPTGRIWAFRLAATASVMALFAGLASSPDNQKVKISDVGLSDEHTALIAEGKKKNPDNRTTQQKIAAMQAKLHAEAAAAKSGSTGNPSAPAGDEFKESPEQKRLRTSLNPSVVSATPLGQYNINNTAFGAFAGLAVLGFASGIARALSVGKARKFKGDNNATLLEEGRGVLSRIYGIKPEAASYNKGVQAGVSHERAAIVAKAKMEHPNNPQAQEVVVSAKFNELDLQTKGALIVPRFGEGLRSTPLTPGEGRSLPKIEVKESLGADGRAIETYDIKRTIEPTMVPKPGTTYADHYPEVFKPQNNAAPSAKPNKGSPSGP